MSKPCPVKAIVSWAACSVRGEVFRRFRIELLWALFPAVSAVVLVTLLAELKIIEFTFSVRDVHTFIALLVLLLAISVSSGLILRVIMRRRQRKSAQEALVSFTEDRARFLRRLDHEIKNPLMGIRIALDNVAEVTDLEERRQIRSAIYEQIDRLNRLISDLRKISEFDRLSIEQLPIDTSALLHDAFNLALEHELAPVRHLSMDIPETLPEVCGDYDLLLLAIYNVINNAIKYSHEGAEVCLQASRTGDKIRISITDTGIGIAAKDLPFVWDELYRAESVKETAGYGIGLALVKRIIGRHSGSVSLTSQLGIGTEVAITLPTTPVSK